MSVSGQIHVPAVLSFNTDPPVPTPSSQHPPSAPLTPTLTPKQLLTEWIRDALSPRAILWDRRVKKTTHLHLLSSLRKRAAVPPLSHTPSYHAQRQLYPICVCVCVSWILTPSGEYGNTKWLSVDKLDTQCLDGPSPLCIQLQVIIVIIIIIIIISKSKTATVSVIIY